MRNFFLLSIACWLFGSGNATSEVLQTAKIGVNKVDLLSQYLGTASGGDGTSPYLRVTRAMARKALDDAKDAGVGMMRVSICHRPGSKFGGLDNIDLWHSKPDLFWEQVDEMMNEMDMRGIRLVPVLICGGKKFPDMTGETMGDLIRDPNSKAWVLLSSYVSDFVIRYRKRSTILFYELTNELNNEADIDQIYRCAKARRKHLCETSANFSTDEMVSFVKRLADMIRALDNSHLISSGFSIPRSSAEHLRARPEWISRRVDWTPDSREQFAKNLKDIHADVDVISIHLYGGDKNKRFGSSDAVDLLTIAKQVADEIGKPLFVGEFGDANPIDAGDDSHVVRMIKKISELGVAYSAVWVWEFYQKKTYLTYDSKASLFSLEPGYTDYLIEWIRAANGIKNLKPDAKDKDESPPRVVLTWPLECMVLNNPVDLHAAASDNFKMVKKVEFLVDGIMLAVDNALPYQVTFSPASIKGGIHRLSAKAYDIRGNVAEFSSDVIVGSSAGGASVCTANM